MPPVFIPFDGWSPGGGYFGEGWAVASNLYPGFGSVGRPWRQFSTVGTGVVDGPMLGSHSHVWAAGVASAAYTPDAQTLFVGSATKLYTVSPSTGAFTDLSRGGGYAAAGQPAGWRFATIGNDIWAANGLDAMQRRTNNAGNFANGVVSTFKPAPRFLAPVREHMVVANLNQAGRFQDEVAWSTDDDATNFDPPAATSISLAGAKRLTSIPGQITGFLGGQYGLAFKRSGIFYLEYTGTSQVLRPEILSETIGCAFPSSIIRTRYGIFFLGQDGFYQIVGLAPPVPISPPGVNAFLFGNTFAVEPTVLSPWQEDTQAEAFTFAGLPLIGWAYRDTVGGGIGSDQVVLYDPPTQRWGYGDIQPTQTGAFLSRKGGASLYDSVAGFTYSDGTSKYAHYSGGTSVGQYQSIDIELRFRSADLESAGRQGQSMINWVLPVFSKEASFSSSAVEPTLNLDAALDPFQTGFTTEGPRAFTQRDVVSGAYPFQLAGRFFRLRISIPAAIFENFHGVWIDQGLLT